MSVIGHHAQVGAFRDAAQGGKLHHAWLLTGAQGIGKATFADAAARWLLATAAGPAFDLVGLDVPPEHRAGSLIDAGSHPDLRRLSRITKDKSEELARSISVDQVRGLQSLFATTPSLSARRVIVIDALDDLERAAANALLKNLEEPPPQTTFLLVSHAPARLLPTIRSRCRTLRFAPLDRDDTSKVLRRALPEADGDEIAALARVAQGAPGAAMRFVGLDVSGLDRAIDQLIEDGDPTNSSRAALARALSGKAAQPRYEAFLERSTARLAQAAREGRGGNATIDLWRRSRDIADGAARLSMDPQLIVFELAGLLAQLPALRDAA